MTDVLHLNCTFPFQALDTLGSTRWRVNKRVLNIIDRIWASGGCLADLVDRSDVCLFRSCLFFPQYLIKFLASLFEQLD